MAGVASGPVTSGIQARRDCLAASRAVACQRASALPARSARHRATQRSACQATTASTPTSVMVSTASSPRSPLGMAWTTTILGSAAGSARLASTASSITPGPDAGHHALGDRARPVGDVGPLARGQPAHRGRVAALGPGEHDRAALKLGAAGQEDRWRCRALRLRAPGHLPDPSALARGQRPLNASRSREKKPLLARRELAGRRLLAAQLGQLAQQRLLLRLQLRSASPRSRG